MASLISSSSPISIRDVTIELSELSLDETKSLMFRLGVDLNEIDNVDHAKHTGDIAKAHLVRKWLHSDTKADWKRLASELKEIRKDNLANRVEQKHVPGVSPAIVSGVTDRVTREPSPSLGATDDSDIDYKIKIVLCGDSGVGKTCFVDKYVSGTTKNKYVTTVGANFVYKILTLQGKIMKMQIFDTTGQERFKKTILPYLNGAHGVILMYDVTKEKSFENINKWLKDIKNRSANFTKIVMVGNKIDRKDDRKITSTKGGDLASSHSLRHFETSALNNENVTKAFECLALEVLDHWEKESYKEADGDPRIYTVTTDVENSKSQERRRLSCCRCC